MTDMDKAVEEAAAAVMPFESWEVLPGESGAAYAAFRTFRDFGMERTIRKAVEAAVADKSQTEKRYRVWRNWAMKFRWRERAGEYDRYTEKLQAAEMRKTIEAQGEKHRAVTGKMLSVVEKKLDTINPAELTQGTVTEWVQTAIKAEREAANQMAGGIVAPNGKTELKQGELTFAPDFNGI